MFSEYSERDKDFTLLSYANGFGIWHCKVVFTTPLGNTPEAQAIAARGNRAGRRKIRNEIKQRNLIGEGYRMKYEIADNQTQPGSGCLMSLTIREA